ncbi:Kunitz-type trypsin inhibitor [Quillaja saponaria]|uniref:Kunitz-type trypsin inhibitor n=1 Tax=Quillaja saponaria TaxID=32244 RepID=A0AAD7Q614_QUISA|nr:Kunitz-type trypsin inhibitor [Quillaja saponaria]
MKPALFVLSFFFFVLTTKPLVASAETVLDIDGEPLQWGVNYYILPAFRGFGGGLNLGTINNNTICPLYVNQEGLEISNGRPFLFSSVFSKFLFVTTSTDLQIKSSGITVCIQSMVWKLVKELTGVRFVSTNGVETPGSERIPSLFTIEQDGESDYKIVFCPTESDVPTLCRALGIYIDEDGKRHLALSDEIKPFTFRFKKAEEWASNAEEEDKNSPTSFFSSSLVRIFSKCCI